KIGVCAAGSGLVLRIASQGGGKIETARRRRRLVVVAEEKAVLYTCADRVLAAHDRYRIHEVPRQCAPETDRVGDETSVAIADGRNDGVRNIRRKSQLLRPVAAKTRGLERKVLPGGSNAKFVQDGGSESVSLRKAGVASLKIVKPVADRGVGPGS